MLCAHFPVFTFCLGSAPNHLILQRMIDLNQTVLIIGTTPIAVGDLVLACAALALVLLAIMATLSISAARERKSRAVDMADRETEFDLRFAELTGRLQSLAEGTATRDAHMAKSLDQRLDQISLRMGQNLHDTTKRTTDSLRQLHERLAVIDAAQKNITDLSSQVVGLQDILANKQARGAFGQGRMEAIVADALPRNAYTFQHTLSNKTRPDCIVRLPNNDAVLVIDAKFPLEAFKAFREAGDEASMRAAVQQVRTDITQHINDISKKYLIPGETQDTAIMFVPSESIYADLYESFEEMVQKAYRARILIVSPNMLMLAIQTMQAIFKDAQMREQAGLIKIEVAKMMEDVHRLHGRVVDLQRNFGRASQDIEKILVSSEKVTKRGSKIEQLEFEAPAEDGEASDDSTAEGADTSEEQPRLAAGE